MAAETARLRNISDQALHVPMLGHRLVEPDCVVDIPAALLHHQPACTGTQKRYDEASGTWPETKCTGCLEWPEATWKVESEPKSTKVKE